MSVFCKDCRFHVHTEYPYAPVHACMATARKYRNGIGEACADGIVDCETRNAAKDCELFRRSRWSKLKRRVKRMVRAAERTMWP